MPYTSTRSIDPACLFFRFYGVTSAEQVRRAMRELNQVHRRDGISRALCDVSDLKDSIGMLDLIQLGIEFACPEFEGIKVAFFPAKHPGVEFGSCVVNQCGGSMQIFDCEQASREWLSRQSDNPHACKPGSPGGSPAARSIKTQPLHY